MAIDTTQYSWNEIGNFEQFWDWLEQVYLPLMFNEQWYNSDPLDPLLVHTLNYQSRLVGGYRIGQTRVISLSLSVSRMYCGVIKGSARTHEHET